MTRRHFPLAAFTVACAVFSAACGVHLEDVPRPVTPSAFRFLVPRENGLGLAARCPSCHATSVNVVTAEHVDVPFHCDAHVGVAAHVFWDEELGTIAAFRAELASATFDEKRLQLDG